MSTPDGPTRKPRSATPEVRDKMGFSREDLEPAPLPAQIEKDRQAFDLLDEYLDLEGSRGERLDALMKSHPELDTRRKVTVALNRARKIWFRERSSRTDEAVAEHYMRIDEMMDGDAFRQKIDRGDTNAMRFALEGMQQQRAMIGAGADKGKPDADDVVVNIEFPTWAGRDHVEQLADERGKVVIDIPAPETPDDAA